jgi:ribosomal protein S18 acetylase RimI-like enzyme
MARLVAAGVTLRAQVNKRFESRDKASDGWIGDRAHAARKSQHNPDAKGWVHALDIDADLLGPGRRARSRKVAQELADQLIEYARSGEPGSDRLLYVVFNNYIASGTYSKQFWTWRAGSWGHEHHIHVSFTDLHPVTGRRKFPLPIFTQK